MATIKDVAALAGVSISTVSFVLNGKAGQMKVSDATAQKVLEAAAELQYKPSNAARRLRTATVERPTIALYWPMDSRAGYASLILESIRKEVERQHLDCDLLLRGYHNDYLYQQKEILDSSSYGVAIIGATSAKDSEYIETLSPVLPIILFNRNSSVFSTVLSEEETAIRDAVQLLSDKGVRNIALFRGTKSYTAYDYRLKTLMNTLAEYGIEVAPEHNIEAEDRCESGASAARKLLLCKHRPQALITMTDTIALGASYVLCRAGVRLPEDMLLLTFSIGDPDITKYATPSLSAIEMSTKDMAEHAAAMAIHRIRTGVSVAPESHQIRNRLILRESCPE
jgi:DNA-binding LacI/PurR family transcriptional regulator